MASYRGVKYCQNCGKAYNLNFPNKCIECGEPIRTKAQQREIKRLSSMRHYYEKKDELLALSSELALLQIDLPVLTEAEWNKAVNHFKGCALCGAPEIDARMMLLLPSEGGRYNRGNVLPACTKCAAAVPMKGWATSIRATLRTTGDKSVEKRFKDAVAYLKQEAMHE